MKYKNYKNKNSGFTVIEIVIAVGLFTVVMIIGIGAVLRVNQIHKKTSDTRQAIDSMHFVLEDMSRNIRLGSFYNCRASVGGLGETEDCPFEEGITPYQSMAFEKVNGNITDDGDQVVYRIIEIPGTGIYKLVKGAGIACATSPTGSGCLDLTPYSVHIDPNKSGFNIENAENPDPMSGDGTQPKVTIRLAGDIVYLGITTPFSVQTTISQRQIDF